MTATTRRRVRIATVGLMVLLPSAAPGLESGTRITAPERRHEVRPGDTLWSIGRRYGVSVEALVAANGLSGPGAPLPVGRRLVIPGRPPTGGRAVGSAAAALANGSLRVVEPPEPRRTEVGRLRAPADLVLKLPDFGESTPLFAWPAEGRISSPFGPRRSGWHGGIDIKADAGAPVSASAAGVVVASGWETRYGRVVKIEHRDGFITVYAHNTENLVEVGERVRAGQPIARVGRSGRATTDHLHFEIRRGGLAYNPLFFLPLPSRLVWVEEPRGGPDEHDE